MWCFFVYAGTGSGVAEYGNGHWDSGNEYGGQGRGYARGRSSHGRGRWRGGGNMQLDSGYNNGYSGSLFFPAQGRGNFYLYLQNFLFSF